MGGTRLAALSLASNPAKEDHVPGNPADVHHTARPQDWKVLRLEHRPWYDQAERFRVHATGYKHSPYGTVIAMGVVRWAESGLTRAQLQLLFDTAPCAL